jgi:inner membrane transporter RhtA
MGASVNAQGGVPWLSVAMLVAAMVSIQLGAAFAEGLFPAVGAQGTTALRLTFSALMLTAAHRPWRNLRLDRSVLPLLAYGLSLGTMNTLFYLALRTVPLGVAIALEFVGPLAVAVAGSRRWSDGLWIALALVGLGLLLPLGHAARGIDPVGAMLALGSGAAWGLYIVFGRRVGVAYGSRGAALGMIIAALVFAPLGVAAAGPARFTLALLPSGALLALLSSAIPYSLEMAALSRMPSRAFGTLMSLEPAIGALAGLAILHQRLAPPQWAGLAAVMLASLGTALTLRTDAPAPPAS